MPKKTLDGIFAPITTPFINDEVSLDQLKKNVQKYSQTPLKGYFVLGSNGESKCCTEAEKLQILELVLKEKSPNQAIMAGAGYESARQTIEFSKKVASMGADFVSLVTPSYQSVGFRCGGALPQSREPWTWPVIMAALPAYR